MTNISHKQAANQCEGICMNNSSNKWGKATHINKKHTSNSKRRNSPLQLLFLQKGFIIYSQFPTVPPWFPMVFLQVPHASPWFPYRFPCRFPCRFGALLGAAQEELSEERLSQETSKRAGSAIRALSPAPGSNC